MTSSNSPNPPNSPKSRSAKTISPIGAARATQILSKRMHSMIGIKMKLDIPTSMGPICNSGMISATRFSNPDRDIARINSMIVFD
jgi:hypothetical protein